MKKVKVYMKSGNLVKFNAEDVEVKFDRSGVFRELRWKESKYAKYGILKMLDINNIEAIVIDE